MRGEELDEHGAAKYGNTRLAKAHLIAAKIAHERAEFERARKFAASARAAYEAAGSPDELAKLDAWVATAFAEHPGPP